jgi:phenol 2-monooxygenase
MDGLTDLQWAHSAIATHDRGTILCIPRERGMTRLYIELSNGSKSEAAQEFVMARAREIMAPFSVEWRSVEWFGVYQSQFWHPSSTSVRV